MHGPQGFLRQFSGKDGVKGPEVTAVHEHSGDVRLALVNHGPRTVELTVKDGYGKQRNATYRLRPGARAEHIAQTGHSDQWYEVSVTSDLDGSFLRLLAGHVETGKATLSDPKIATV